MTSYWVQLATEQFPPSELVDQARRGRAGRLRRAQRERSLPALVGAGHSGQAWVTLGAIGQATERIGLGTGVTAPVYRYHPAVVAQFGRRSRSCSPAGHSSGIGSGESLNESPAGMDWPGTGEQVRRMEEALEIIDAPARRRAGRPRRPLLPHQGRVYPHPRRAPPARSTSLRSARTRRASRRASATASGRSPTLSRRPS